MQLIQTCRIFYLILAELFLKRKTEEFIKKVKSYKAWKEGIKATKLVICSFLRGSQRNASVNEAKSTNTEKAQNGIYRFTERDMIRSL